MPTFELQADDAFRIVRRGLCLRGTIRRGQITVGDRVSFERLGTQVVGTVAEITVDGAIVDEATAGTELGLLLSHLTDRELDASLHPTREQLERPEPPLAIPLPQIVRAVT